MKLLFTALLALISTTAFSQEEEEEFEFELAHADIIGQQVIPEDTTIRKGTLPNGLTYYICTNTKPEKRVFLRLLVKVGSLVEQDNERGIAHFVEHMMYKGSKHFPTSDNVLGFLRRHGFPLGHDSNAFTYHELTEYMMNDIPSDNTLLQDSCLLFLRDIAGDAFISDAAVESERNVIVEEWRGRNLNASAVKMQKRFFNDSLYANRFPIGDMDIVKNCSPSLIRDFYKRWYQPQNLAVVAVGDFDADEMEQKIRALFGDLKRGTSVVPPLPKMADTEKPEFSVFIEPQMLMAQTAVYVRLPFQGPKENVTVDDLKETYVQDKIAYIFKDFKFHALKENFDIVSSAGASITSISKSKGGRILHFVVNSSTENWKEAQELLFKQIELTRRKGFTEEAIGRMGSIAQDFYNIEADTTAIKFSQPYSCDSVRNSTKLIDKLTSNFLGEEAIISAKSEEMVKYHTSSTISLDEFNESFRKLTDGRNMYVFTVFPSADKQPNDADVEEVYNRVRNMTDDELADVGKPAPKRLMGIIVDSTQIDPIPGVVKKTIVRNDSITEARLSNGIKVFFWKKKTSDNYVNMKLVRPMGYSVLSNEDYCYKFMLANKSSFRIHIPYNGREKTPSVPNEWHDELLFSSPSNSKTIDKALKYFHLRLSPSEIDTVGFNDMRKLVISNAQMHASPIQQSANKINFTYCVDPQRLFFPTPEKAAAFNISHFKEIVDDYTSNWNGSVLVIQGEYDTDSIMSSVLKYIGSLPSKPEPVHYKVWPSDQYKTTNSTATAKIESGTPICQTLMYYTWTKGYKYMPQTHAMNQVLSSILNNLLFSIIRGQHSDVYAASCGISDNLIPLDRMAFVVNFTCNPKERERIAGDIDRLMHEIADGDQITQELIDGYIKERERTMKTPDYNDLNLFVNRELYGMEMDETDLSYIRKVTPKSLKAHMKHLLKKGNLHVGYLTTE